MKTSLNFIISNINKNIIDLSATLKELKELQKLECLNQPEITEQDYLKIIKKFPKYNTLSIEDLKNRKQLVLSRKNFTDISPLRNLFNLRYLNLELNNITDISPLRNLNKLKKLNLSCNNISDISFLKNLYNLKYLNIWNNPIKRNKIYELEVALPNCEIFIGIR